MQTLPNSHPSDEVAWDLLALARFLLAFIVLCFHMTIFFGAEPLLAAISRLGGKAAVVGFLIISGFSIHNSLLREPAGFLWRRFVRIYPAYILAIASAFALQQFTGEIEAPLHVFNEDSNLVFFCNALMLQMFACKAVDFNLSVWSLSIEFSFYIAAIVVLIRMNTRWLIFIAVASMIMFILPNDLIDGKLYYLATKFKPPKYMWPFIVGFILYRDFSAMKFIIFAALSVVLFLISPEMDASTEPLGPLTIVVTLLTIWVARSWKGAQSKALTYLGDLSYPLYLVHLPVFIALFALQGELQSWVAIAAVMLAAAGTVAFVEKPARRQLKRLRTALSQQNASL
ncbi:acyltransferase family protein [Alsobacter sp. R-9]